MAQAPHRLPGKWGRIQRRRFFNRGTGIHCGDAGGDWRGQGLERYIHLRLLPPAQDQPAEHLRATMLVVNPELNTAAGVAAGADIERTAAAGRDAPLWRSGRPLPSWGHDS